MGETCVSHRHLCQDNSKYTTAQHQENAKLVFPNKSHTLFIFLLLTKYSGRVICILAPCFEVSIDVIVSSQYFNNMFGHLDLFSTDFLPVGHQDINHISKKNSRPGGIPP